MVQGDGPQIYLGSVYPFRDLSPKSGAGSKEPEQGRIGSQAGTRLWHGLLGRGPISHDQREIQSCLKGSA